MWSARKQLAAGSYRVNALLTQVGQVRDALARVCRRMQQEPCRDIHILVARHCTQCAPMACCVMLWHGGWTCTACTAQHAERLLVLFCSLFALTQATMSLQAFCLADRNAIRPIDPETSAIWGFSFIYVVIGHTKVTAAAREQLVAAAYQQAMALGRHPARCLCGWCPPRYPALTAARRDPQG